MYSIVVGFLLLTTNAAQAAPSFPELFGQIMEFRDRVLDSRLLADVCQIPEAYGADGRALVDIKLITASTVQECRRGAPQPSSMVAFKSFSAQGDSVVVRTAVRRDGIRFVEEYRIIAPDPVFVYSVRAVYFVH